MPVLNRAFEWFMSLTGERLTQPDDKVNGSVPMRPNALPRSVDLLGLEG